jgi:hypothetical protein
MFAGQLLSLAWLGFFCAFFFSVACFGPRASASVVTFWGPLRECALWLWFNAPTIPLSPTTLLCCSVASASFITSDLKYASFFVFCFVLRRLAMVPSAWLLAGAADGHRCFWCLVMAPLTNLPARPDLLLEQRKLTPSTKKIQKNETVDSTNFSQNLLFPCTASIPKGWFMIQPIFSSQHDWAGLRFCRKYLSPCD